MYVDALLAKEAALSLSAERLECINLLENERAKMRKEYEILINVKVRQLHCFH